MSRLAPALVMLCVLGAWSLAAARLPPVLVPSPVEVLLALSGQAPRLGQAAAVTAVSALGGLCVAFAVGMAGAIGFVRFRWLELAFYPYALALQTVPIVAIAPLLVVWLGYGPPVAVSTAAIASFFPILTSANVGLRAAEAEQLELLRLYGASRWQELWLLRLPGSLPYLFAGLRTAAGLGVIGAIVGELVGSNGAPLCLGYLVLHSARTADTPTTFAAITVATALSAILFGAVRWTERRVIGAWHAGGQR